MRGPPKAALHGAKRPRNACTAAAPVSPQQCKAEPALAQPAENEAARTKRLEKNRRSAQRHRAKIKHEAEVLVKEKAELVALTDALQQRVSTQAAHIQELQAQLVALQATRSDHNTPAPACVADDTNAAPPMAQQGAVPLLPTPQPSASGSATTSAARIMRCNSAAHAVSAQLPGGCECQSSGRHESKRLCAALVQLGLPESAPRLPRPCCCWAPE